jgi:hypothetical protein
MARPDGVIRETEHRSPPFVSVLLVVVAVLEVAWIVVLFRNQVPAAVAHHLRKLWTGLDAAEVAALALTGIYHAKRSVWVIVSGSIAGTLLITDAWFNVMATVGRPHAAAVFMAIFAEIPLAVLCFSLAIRCARQVRR